MAFIRTAISGAVGDKSMGKPAPNKPDDVKKIQGLLAKTLGSSAPTFKDGVCDDALKKAIADFQRMWGAATDSTVDPHGETLKRLNRMANPLTLNAITLNRVVETYNKKGKMIADGGGYNISVKAGDSGALPPASSGYTLHLLVSDQTNVIDVTDRQPGDLISKDNLCELLAIIEKLGAWTTSLQCRVQVRYKDAVISTTDAQMLRTPVQPHNGVMLPLDETNNGAKLTYQGDPKAEDFHGRMFVEVPGFAKKLFIYGGLFETSNDFRGFDCITYAGTTCGAENTHMADSKDLANSLGATTVTHTRTTKDAKGKETTVTVQLETADPAYVKEFFAENTTGYFLMFTGGHIVLVIDGSVHEFKGSDPKGYNCTDVTKWLEPYKTMKLTVRRLPAKPARAA